MSDGPSDCAYAAEARAERLVAAKWPKVRRIHFAEDAPKQGIVLYVYETWLTHVVELITNRVVGQRWRCEPFDEPKRMAIGKHDWAVGYYHDHTLPKEVKR